MTRSIIQFISVCFLFSSLSIYAQNDMGPKYPMQSEGLKIDLKNKKEIRYKGENVNIFDNNIYTDETALTPLESLPDGKYIAFYKNDTSKLAFEVNYFNKKRTGIQRQYYLNGQIKFLDNYINGKLNGQSFYYLPDGKIQRISNYKDGELDGKNEFYLSNGVKETEREYKKGKLNGVSKIWNDKGVLIREEFYKNDKKKKCKEDQ